MADENKAINIDTMSDEDFMKLDPSQLEEVSVVEDTSDPDERDGVNGDIDPDGEGNDNLGENPDDKVDPEGGDSTGSKTSDPDSNDDEDTPDSVVDPEDESKSKDSVDGKTIPSPKEKDEKPKDPSAGEEPEKEPEKAANGDAKPKKVDPKVAIDFFEKISAPFKADGRTMQVRTAEDVIRLMQMGVNYSRRMQEMKPLRAQDQMLKSNGLNDPEKLNFLIDLSKGNKDAIRKLLSDYKIDPVDIDTSSEDKPYQATDYQGDPKDLAFDDAIKETLAQDGGRDLISDINREWDDVSKEALRDQPAIFQNILAQKRTGVYGKIKEELNYQRTMGFLTDVPYLQAYHQVGEAMQKAGVFGFNDKTQPGVKKPLGTGTRKAAPKPKIEQPTPNVSSATPPRSVSANAGGQQDEPDFSSMSDADFLKLVPPS